jgi:hypothetical protein
VGACINGYIHAALIVCGCQDSAGFLILKVFSKVHLYPPLCKLLNDYDTTALGKPQGVFSCPVFESITIT